MAHKGFYRHYKGHVYFVHGIGEAKHENNRRMVVYTSTKTEMYKSYEFLLREEKEFDQWVYTAKDRSEPPPPIPSPAREDQDHFRSRGYEPRFLLIIDPECSILPPIPSG